MFQGNQKNIGVGLSGQNNADSSLFTKKVRAISGLSGGSAISRHARMLNLARFNTKFVAVQKILLSALWQQICPGLILIRCMQISISVTKCLIALLLIFNTTCFPEY